jgi:hypothetical protein
MVAIAVARVAARAKVRAVSHHKPKYGGGQTLNSNHIWLQATFHPVSIFVYTQTTLGLQQIDVTTTV